ncbi:MAG TPA: imidazolonepropionase [Bryobacteraceae bacterium]|nr:imidazolonepropionase [Bryobacteraceae bacterium]
MPNAILVRGARQLLTLRGPSGPRRGAALNNLGITEDGAVLIVNGVIVELGLTRRVENLTLARNAREIDAHGRVVMPGFVDSHTHLISGLPPLAAFEQVIQGTRPPEEMGARAVLAAVKGVRETPERLLKTQAAAILRDCLRHGTTTLEAKSGYALNEGGELKILRVLAALNQPPFDVASTFFGAQAIAPEYEARPDEYIDWLCGYMLPLIRRRKLAEFVDAWCDRGALTSSQARRILEAARGLGFPIKVHADQFGNHGGVALAVELGAVSVDHLAFTGGYEADLLVESATIATLLPGAVFHLAWQQYAAARQLIDRGVAVALASNYSRTVTPSYNMQMVLALACREMRMTAAEAISAATINGAHALRRSHRIGSLEIGKDADLILLNASDYREIAYGFGGNLVAMTMKRGEIVYNSSEASCGQETSDEDTEDDD